MSMMNPSRKCSISFFFLFFSYGISQALCAERAQIIVAADGSGNFKTIQEALNSIPKNNASNIIILIKKGTYQEKLFVEKSFITLVGEDRDSTRIVYAELREKWLQEHNGSDWGSAVVNIDSQATDITIANLTIHNNYGSLYHIPKHQFAIRGNGTRIRILYCNVIADGADTISLWDRADGMYYHSNCYFEGWVDYVCPRGWCDISDSRFYGHNLSASIWHDGSFNKDQKLVIRYSYFDGVPGFPLGRHHRDAQIYLLNCIFSRNLADMPIYPPISPNAKEWKWGARHYFFNCHREGGDYEWFTDNLSDADNSPNVNEMTAKWTFGGRWDPEGTMPSVLAFVSQPSPREGAYEIACDRATLKWVPSRNKDLQVVNFGKSNNAEFRGSQKHSAFNPGELERRTRYYWRIDEINGSDTLRGPVWHFTTN
jgi:pectinesterase